MDSKSDRKGASRRAFLRNSALTALAALGAATVGACGATPTPTPTKAPVVAPTPPPAATPTKPPAQPVTLRIHYREGVEGDVIKERMTAFGQKFPNIKVELEGFANADYQTKVLTLIAGGTVGDVLWGATHSGLYQLNIVAKALRSIDDLVARDKFDLSAYFTPSIEKMKSVDGKLYGLPFKGHTGATALYYNIDMVKGAGLTAPGDATSVSDLLDMAKKLTKKDASGKVTQWGIVLNIISEVWVLSLANALTGAEWYSEDGKKSLINSESFQEALKWIYDRIKTDPVAPSIAVSGPLDTIYRTYFASGQAGLLQSGSWDKAAEATVKGAFKWTVVPFPKGKTGSRGAKVLTDTMSISAASKNPDAAWELLKWVTDQETGLRLGEGFGPAQSGTTGARWDVYNSPRLKDPARGYPPEVQDAFITLMKEASLFRGAANFRDVEHNGAAKQLMGAILSGEQEPTKAYLDNIQKSLQEILDKPKP